MSDIKIKVTTETLLKVSEDVSQKICEVQNAFEEIEMLIRGTLTYWEGDGQKQYLQNYQTREEGYEKIFSDLTDHVKNLQVIAGGYAEAEKAVTEYSQILPGDVIV